MLPGIEHHPAQSIPPEPHFQSLMHFDPPGAGHACERVLPDRLRQIITHVV